jgi:hypothetical protein
MDKACHIEKWILISCRGTKYYVYVYYYHRVDTEGIIRPADSIFVLTWFTGTLNIEMVKSQII